MNDDVRAQEQKNNGKPCGLRRFKALLLAGAFIMTAAVIGVTYAWNMHEVSLDNNLQSHNTSVKINEDFPTPHYFSNGAERTKKVSFENTGSSPVFLRVAWSETWTTESVNYPELNAWYEDGGYTTINWTTEWNSEWVLLDGWYYYKNVLPAGASTANIMNSVKFVNFPSPFLPNYYDLTFLAEVVQLSDEAGVNTSAVHSVFPGRNATVTITSTSNGAVTGGTVAWS